MSVPSWARGRGAWDPNPGVAWEDHAPGGRPPLARSPQPQGRRSPSRRRRVATTRKQDSSSGGSESKYIRLGRTQGVFGAGAWAARAEICELLEGGATPGEVIRAIRSGEEARDELASFPSSFVEQPPARALRPEADTKERPQPRSTGEPSQSQKAKEEAAGPMTVPKSRPSGPAGSLGFRKRAEPPPLERRRHGHRPERPPRRSPRRPVPLLPKPRTSRRGSRRRLSQTRGRTISQASRSGRRPCLHRRRSGWSGASGPIHRRRFR